MKSGAQFVEKFVLNIEHIQYVPINLELYLHFINISKLLV